MEGKLDLVLDLMFPRGSCCLSGQMARPLLSWQLSQRPAQGMVCVHRHGHREPQSGVAGTHACHPPFIALVACAQRGQKASWVLGWGWPCSRRAHHLLLGPGRPHTSPDNWPQRLPALPPCCPACPLSIALGGWFPKANMIISLAIKSLPWTPMALRTKPCSQLPGTCLRLPCGLGGFQAHLHCIPVSPPPARLHGPISADNVTEAGTGSVTSAVSPTGKATILPISAGNPVHPGPGLSLIQA